jgi:hypothetical protein
MPDGATAIACVRDGGTGRFGARPSRKKAILAARLSGAWLFKKSPGAGAKGLHKSL